MAKACQYLVSLLIWMLGTGNRGAICSFPLAAAPCTVFHLREARLMACSFVRMMWSRAAGSSSSEEACMSAWTAEMSPDSNVTSLPAVAFIGVAGMKWGKVSNAPATASWMESRRLTRLV